MSLPPTVESVKARLGSPDLTTTEVWDLISQYEHQEKAGAVVDPPYLGWLVRGLCHQRLHEYERATAMYDEVLARTDGGYVAAYARYELAGCYIGRGQYELAKAHLTSCRYFWLFGGYPADHARALERLADLQLAQDKSPLAEATLTSLVEELAALDDQPFELSALIKLAARSSRNGHEVVSTRAATSALALAEQLGDKSSERLARSLLEGGHERYDAAKNAAVASEEQLAARLDDGLDATPLSGLRASLLATADQGDDTTTAFQAANRTYVLALGDLVRSRPPTSPDLFRTELAGMLLRAAAYRDMARRNPAFHQRWKSALIDAENFSRNQRIELAVPEAVLDLYYL